MKKDPKIFIHNLSNTTKFLLPTQFASPQFDKSKDQPLETVVSFEGFQLAQLAKLDGKRP